MKRILAIVALTMSPLAGATELYCEGTAWAASGQQFNHSMVLILDKESGMAKATTFSGSATGKLEQGDQLYTGYLRTEKVTYWINLDKFNGSFILMLMKPDNTPGMAEFSGTCDRREPKF